MYVKHNKDKMTGKISLTQKSYTEVVNYFNYLLKYFFRINTWRKLMMIVKI